MGVNSDTVVLEHMCVFPMHRCQQVHQQPHPKQPHPPHKQQSPFSHPPPHLLHHCFQLPLANHCFHQQLQHPMHLRTSRCFQLPQQGLARPTNHCSQVQPQVQPQGQGEQARFPLHHLVEGWCMTMCSVRSVRPSVLQCWQACNMKRTGDGVA